MSHLKIYILFSIDWNFLVVSHFSIDFWYILLMQIFVMLFSMRTYFLIHLVENIFPHNVTLTQLKPLSVHKAVVSHLISSLKMLMRQNISTLMVRAVAKHAIAGETLSFFLSFSLSLSLQEKWSTSNVPKYFTFLPHDWCVIPTRLDVPHSLWTALVTVIPFLSSGNKIMSVSFLIASTKK